MKKICSACGIINTYRCGYCGRELEPQTDQPEPAQPLKDGWLYWDDDYDVAVKYDAGTFQGITKKGNNLEYEAYIAKGRPATLAHLAVKIDGADGKKVKIWFVEGDMGGEINIYIMGNEFIIPEMKFIGINRIIIIKHFAKLLKACVICEEQWKSLMK